MNFTSALLSKLLASSNIAQEAALLHAYLQSCEKSGHIAEMAILEDTPREPLCNEQHRFRIELELSDKTPLNCTGVAFHREDALLKALAEAVERLLFLESAKGDWECCFGGTKTLQIPTLDSTNGIAFHNNSLDCLSRAAFELVERHAVVGHWYTRSKPIARIDCTGVHFLENTRARLASIGARFEVFLLDQIGPVSVVLCLATSLDPRFGFHVLVGSAAHLSIYRAVERAFAEFATDFLWQPLTKLTRAYPDPSSVVGLIDHQLYFQSPERIKYFDFFFNENLPIVKLERSDIGTICFARKFFSFLADFSFQCWIHRRIPTLNGFWLSKASSPRLMEIGFGEKHANMDVALLKQFGSNVVLDIPHPIA